MAQIYLVRHTKVAIPMGICYGASDVPLAVTFADEALVIQKQLKDKTFHSVFSSPLFRCTQLAEILAPSNFIIDNRLKEINFGDWELKPWDEIYQNPYGKEWMNNYQSLTCPRGEGYSDLYNRVDMFIHDLKARDNLLVITHAGVIRIFLTILEKYSITEAMKKTVDYGEIIKVDC